MVITTVEKNKWREVRNSSGKRISDALLRRRVRENPTLRRGAMWLRGSDVCQAESTARAKVQGWDSDGDGRADRSPMWWGMEGWGSDEMSQRAGRGQITWGPQQAQSGCSTLRSNFSGKLWPLCLG